MCNYSHPDSLPIPPTGFGYKLFNTAHPDALYSLVCGGVPYMKDPNGWVTWRKNIPGLGFCFFLTRKEARICCKLWQDTHKATAVRRIQYAGGICRHLEPGFLSHYLPKIALCKSFKVIKSKRREP